jgi:NAD(P)-dependent dehydrogenase (short-subunit alcohol dehydrogenase family)
MSAAEFVGKRVFVTGGGKGVGEAIVRRFAAGGATVGTTARSPLATGNAAKLFVQADLSTQDGVKKNPPGSARTVRQPGCFDP